ncbi:MAG: outer membrane beta-barrel protein [Ignavibacteriales bacterium]|nr:outer membrane beta-barrel protein [Ignavibacteriales bacterium]
MKLRSQNHRAVSATLVVVALMIASLSARGGDIKPSVEVEFNIFYNKNFPQPLSFQFREAKLFLDTYINESSTALIEYTMKDNLKRAELERAYFIQHDLPLNSQLTMGQFRSPFGYFDPFTVTHSITKDAALAPDSAMPKFRLRSLDVGVMWESLNEPFSFSLAVVNGNNINELSDDNNFKDIIGHVLFSSERFQIGANGYYGRKNSLNADGAVRTYSDVEVTAIGIEAMLLTDKAVIAGEALVRNYGSLHSAGGYVMMNYDLASLVPKLRTTTRFEIFDPNVNVFNDERMQWSQGFLYSISRGYLAKFEWVINLERHRMQENEIFFELEYEL